MCLDFHRNHGFLLAVGFHDGHLAVYNVSLPTKEAQYMTDAVNTKHMACVRQVNFFMLLYSWFILNYYGTSNYILGFERSDECISFGMLVLGEIKSKNY